jgi:hypothetical protein
VVVDVGDDHLGGPRRAGDLRDEEADGSRAGDEHAVAEPDLGALHGPHRDRERLDHRADDRVDGVGQRVRRPVRHDEVLGHGAVRGRRAEAGAVRADVVRPLQARRAASAPERGFHGDPGADGDAGARPGRHDHARSLVTEDGRLPQHVRPVAPGGVVVHVRAADADRGDPHEHVRRARRRDVELGRAQVTGAVQHGRAGARRHCGRGGVGR